MSTRAVPGSLSERYGVVLQELRLEMLRHKPSLLAEFPGDQIQQQSRRSGQSYNPFSHTQTGQETDTRLNGTNGDEAIDSSLVFQDGQAPQMVEPSPSSSVAQMSGWGQFDSLVSLAEVCDPYLLTRASIGNLWHCWLWLGGCFDGQSS